MLTSAESERLRNVSHQRQLEAGTKSLGGKRLTPGRFGDIQDQDQEVEEIIGCGSD